MSIQIDAPETAHRSLGSVQCSALRVLMQSFLGDVPRLPGLDAACGYQPASRSEGVGGDFFDFLELADGLLAIVIADVSGKGVAAGAHLATVKYLLRAHAFERPRLDRLMGRLNRALCREMRDAEMFVSLAYVVLDLRAETVTWANAGHPAPLLLPGPAADCIRLEVTGGVLGVSPDWTYGHRTVPLPENSILALFTDGITEASRQPDAAEDGGVGVLLARDRARPAARLVRSILDAAAAAASGHLQDDVALVVVKRLPAERLPASLEEPRVAGSFLELMHTHELLDALFARHQEALLGSDIDQARELLRRYERELNAHMRVEEDLLLPVYERAGRVAGGPPEFYTGEHQRMREFVGRFHESLDELALNPPEAPQRVIALLDQQAIYKHLVEHHDLREQNLLYPILDRVTADSERAELMARALAPPREGARA